MQIVSSPLSEAERQNIPILFYISVSIHRGKMEGFGKPAKAPM
jgi:hypothetical protein